MNLAFLFGIFFQSFLYIFTDDAFLRLYTHFSLVLEVFLEAHVILWSAEKKPNIGFLIPQIEYIYRIYRKIWQNKNQSISHMFYSLNLPVLACLFLDPNKLRVFTAIRIPFVMIIYIISSYGPVFLYYSPYSTFFVTELQWKGASTS